VTDESKRREEEKNSLHQSIDDVFRESRYKTLAFLIERDPDDGKKVKVNSGKQSSEISRRNILNKQFEITRDSRKGFSRDSREE
jgi:hypothetical protein